VADRAVLFVADAFIGLDIAWFADCYRT